MALLAASLVFGIGLIVLINLVSPDRIANLLLFYFLAAGLTFNLGTLAIFQLRKILGQREFLNTYLKTSLREGLWLAIILLASLLLLHHHFFSWINAGLLVLIFIFLESYLLTKN